MHLDIHCCTDGHGLTDASRGSFLRSFALLVRVICQVLTKRGKGVRFRHRYFLNFIYIPARDVSEYNIGSWRENHSREGASRVSRDGQGKKRNLYNSLNGGADTYSEFQNQNHQPLFTRVYLYRPSNIDS